MKFQFLIFIFLITYIYGNNICELCERTSYRRNNCYENGIHTNLSIYRESNNLSYSYVDISVKNAPCVVQVTNDANENDTANWSWKIKTSNKYFLMSIREPKESVYHVRFKYESK